MNPTTCPHCNEQATSKLFKAVGYASSIHCNSCGASLKIDEKKSLQFINISVIVFFIMWLIFQISWWICLLILLPISTYRQYKSPLILVYANS